MSKTKYFIGIPGRVMKPTKKHRAAIWECMLGTVYAMNDEGKVEYFDYDYTAAREFASIPQSEESRDTRIFRTPRTHVVSTARQYLSTGKTAVFILRKEM